jgi:alanine-glyoxylate transaminase / serine-glyoxylate transaminase / serine-pyruvate transaminase
MHLEVANPELKAVNPPRRLLLGPGPQNAHPRVHAAMSLPQIGHMDPSFMTIMDETKSLLKYVWQTENRFTIPVSGTGSAAWEAAIANLTEPGDVHLICVNGYFGERALDMHSRYGAVITKISKPDGEVFTVEEIRRGILEHKPKLVWVCHAETSTGTLQPMEGVGEVCRENNCLLLLDTVTSICGSPVFLDKWKVDAAYAGGQKCMGCPPGVSCLSLNERAIAKLESRKSPVASWYLDLTMIKKYLDVPSGAVRTYHHTAPISMIYAMRESLQIVSEEGIEASWAKHKAVASLLYAKITEIEGFELHVKDAAIRNPALTTIRVPQDVPADKIIKFVRENYEIEIGGGLGSLKDKVIRIGLMGYNARSDNVLLVVAAISEAVNVIRGHKLTV